MQMSDELTHRHARTHSTYIQKHTWKWIFCSSFLGKPRRNWVYFCNNVKGSEGERKWRTEAWLKLYSCIMYKIYTASIKYISKSIKLTKGKKPTANKQLSLANVSRRSVFHGLDESKLYIRCISELFDNIFISFRHLNTKPQNSISL